MAKPSPYSSIVILTGAGISAESGIRTFRACDGLWEDHRIEDVAAPEGFRRNPGLVHRFYNIRRQQLATVEPNAAHLAIAELTQRYPEQVTVVTQNIDDLHQRAGTLNVLPMHGELLKIRCEQSGEVFSHRADTSPDDICSCCQTAANLRPHIVWFGEMPLFMDDIETKLANCELFLSIGTSGNVYPAAGFAQAATYAGAETIELNLEATVQARFFKQQVMGKASETVPQLLNQLSLL